MALLSLNLSSKDHIGSHLCKLKHDYSVSQAGDTRQHLAYFAWWYVIGVPPVR